MQQKENKKDFTVKHMTLIFLIMLMILTIQVIKRRQKSIVNLKKLQINSKNDIQNDNKKETIQQQIKGPINDEEVYNSPNLHSEEQDELEIPDEIPSDKLN
ncbi:unnamed protein product [Rhizophagus irregularis]|uniref:Transmembrane protein n=1 Tax=Rhizophagus irregularis TaxID=588596 RepID=A0A915YWM4_9GLOM|nr:unnamed protein product [Rhizophagus irregularis]CAB5349497.1 unnamed protein product [Rhizophagus irregularis]